MRVHLVLPVLGLAWVLAACAAAPTEQQAAAPPTGSHIPGAAAGPTTTVGQDELGRGPDNTVTGVLAHSSAWPYISH